MKNLPYQLSDIAALAMAPDQAFVDARDVCIADLINTALIFLTVDPKTGYASSPRNTLCRLVGLLTCQRANTMDELEKMVADAQIALRRRGDLIPRKTTDTAIWMTARHAQTGIESVRDNLKNGRHRLSKLSVEQSRAVINEAYDRHIPALFALLNEEAQQDMKSLVMPSRPLLPGT